VVKEELEMVVQEWQILEGVVLIICGMVEVLMVVLV
jgi:hypothetical protein